MKILSPSSPEAKIQRMPMADEATAVPHAVPHPPAGLSLGDLKAVVKEAVRSTQDDLHALKVDFEKLKTQAMKPAETPAPPSETAAVTQAIDQLNLRMDRMTEQLAELRHKLEAPAARKNTPGPKDPPVPPQEPPKSQAPVLERKPEMTPLKQAERKVAFLPKLWDYLNQVAIEIPLRKQN